MLQKLKVIFQQSLMISTAILFGNGVIAMVEFFTTGETNFSWQWYIPLTIVLSGILCSIPSLLILTVDEEKTPAKQILFRKIIHAVIVWAIVSGCGYVFRWYTSLMGYLMICVEYICIYAFVWVASLWIVKKDEKKINEALDQIRDEE